MHTEMRKDENSPRPWKLLGCCRACYYAKSKRCTCKCRGEGHGKGHKLELNKIAKEDEKQCVLASFGPQSAE